MTSSTISVSSRGLFASNVQSDYYSFAIAYAQTVNLDLAFQYGNASLTLLNSNNQVVGSSSSSATNVDTTLTESLQPGTYYIKLGDNNYGIDNAAYTLNLSLGLPQVGTAGTNNAGATLSTATSIGLLGSALKTLLGSVSTANPTNYYSFTVGSAANVNLDLAGLTGNATLYVLNASGQTVATFSGTSTSPIIASQQLSALAAGTYFIEIKNGSSANGTAYNLGISATPLSDGIGHTTGTATSLGVLAAAQTSTGWVGTLIPDDYYSFTLGAASTINLALTGLSSQASVSLLDASGNRIGGLSYSGNSTWNATGSQTLAPLQAGTYFIDVETYSGTLGTNYTLSASATALPGATSNTAATAVAVGAISATPQVFSGYVGSANQYNYYSFTVATTTTVDFQLADSRLAGDGYVQVNLDNSSLTSIANVLATPNSDGLLSYTVQPGTYYAQVAEYGSNNSPYTLSISSGVPTIGTVTSTTAGSSLGTALNIGTPNAAGQTYTGYVGPSNTDNYYQFTLASAGFVDFEVTGSSDYVLYTYVDSASGQNVANGSTTGYKESYYGSSYRGYLAAGTYYFDVRDSNSGTGYSLVASSTPLSDPGGVTLATADNIGALTATKTFSGVLVSVAPSRYYEFAIASPTNLDLELATAAGNGTSMQLLDISGNRLFNATNNSLITTLLAGTYFVDLGRGSQDTSYTLSFAASADTNYPGISSSGATSLGTLGATTIAIGGTAANQSVSYNATIKPFSQVAITDGSANQTETVVISPAVTADGSFSNLGTGTVNSTTGAYTVSGTAAAVTAAVDALVYTPTSALFSPGQVATVGFSLADSDTLGLAVTDSTTSVVIAGATTVSGVLVSAAAGWQSAPHIVGFSVADTATNIVAGLSALTADTKLSGVTLTGSSNTVTLAQATSLVGLPSFSLGSGAALTVSNPLANNSDGTSYAYSFVPSSVVLEVISKYSGVNGGGTKISDVVNNSNSTSLIYAYNPTSAVKTTASQYAATSGTGGEVSEVVDNVSGTSLVYAYNPTASVLLTAQSWSATNAANGAPAGSEISNVVDNTDGTSLVYAYNPSATVTQTAQKWSGTNSANGAPAGTMISDVVDNGDSGKTSIVYAYNPTTSVTQTATFYSSSDPNTGAPAGTQTAETFDYINGESAITTFHTNSAATTQIYSGVDGGGILVATPASVTLASNTASVSAGLSAASLSFIGTPNVVTLGAGANIVGSTLSSALGVSEINNFVYGLDTLNLYLGGGATSTVSVANTTVNGQHGVSIYSSADPTHGVVLANLGSAMTAADLQSNHLTFANGFAIIS